MKRKLLILFSIMIIAFPGLSYGRDRVEAKYIDVKIAKTYSKMERVKISSSDDFTIYQKDDREEVLLEIPNDTLYISMSLGRNNDIDVYDDSNAYITTLPANGTVLFGHSEDGDGSLIGVNGLQYRGYITFTGDHSGLKVLNHIDIESYLYGVVPKEMPPLGGEEAVKAQAVAARSYTYSTINKHATEGFNVCDTTHCQVYGGYTAEHTNSNKAVDDTAGLVATFNGAVANTVFHSSSGGHTESSENVWGGKVPYLVGVMDTFSLNTTNSKWIVEMDVEKLGGKLISGGVDVGEVSDIEIREVTESGRVVSMVITGTRGDTSISGDKFRSLMGSSDVKSTLFTIAGASGQADEIGDIVYARSDRRVEAVDFKSGRLSVISGDGRITNSSNMNVIGADGIKSYTATETVDISRGSVVISGRGFGHGIGMSQYGAMEMAKLGYDFEKILKHYYTGVEIIKY